MVFCAASVPMPIIDLINRRILDELQRDATLSIVELANRVGLSPTPCWKRVQKLDAEGFIERRVAVLNPDKIGLGLTAFMDIECQSHTADGLASFNEAVLAMPEVVALYRTTGSTDYMLHVVVSDMAAYDAFYNRLVSAVTVKKVSSRFVLERVKETTVLPLPREVSA